MPKLSKPKSFSVSNETIEVDFQGTTCEVANLLKSGITNQTIILVAHADKWHEINILDLGGDDSNLEAFKNFVETMKLSLVDLGIISETVKTNYDLTHQDFMDLQDKFPGYNYIQISKLNDYELKSIQRTGKYHLNETLKYISSKEITIDKYIEESEEQKQKIIGNMKTEKEEVMELEVTEGNQLGIPVEKIDLAPVNAEVINNENTTSAASVPAKKPISIQVFETLTPERISELQGLKEKQIEIVKKNPVIKKITDKTSYELAKKTKSVLLKASTAIDGKDGIEATATKYLNTFKNMLKDALSPIAKLTRDAYDEQSQIISAWENAEALRQQAEQRAKLEKIQKRTDQLFAVPFTFNGTIYSIGNVYCTPSQVETATDEDFNLIVQSGKAIKQALEAELQRQNELANENAELKKQLAAFMALQGMSNTESEPKKVIPTVDKVANFVDPNHMPANNNVANPVPANSILGQTEIQKTQPVYNFPPPENDLLNRLDLENVDHLEKPAYIKCRGYYIRGLKDVAAEIEFILNDATPNLPKKSERIAVLCEILKKSE